MSVPYMPSGHVATLVRPHPGWSASPLFADGCGMSDVKAETPVCSALFGVVAPSFGWAPPLRYLLRRKRVMHLLQPFMPCSLIEVGCGAGALLHELGTGSHDVIGLETSAPALTMARAIAGAAGGQQVLVDAPDPAWQASKDLVCAFDVLEHIENDGAALSTWAAWLKPTGRLCISVPAHRRRWGPGDEWAGHWRRYDRSDLVELLRTQGLIIEHLECYGFPLANLTEWVGTRTYRRLIGERDSGTSRVRATANSGIDRSDYLRLFRWIDSPLGRVGLRVAMVMQAAASRLNWGSGYLVLARRG